FITGLLAGLIGVGISLLLLIPANAILLHRVFNHPDVTAYLQPVSGLILIILSVILTLIGGLIPARSAAKKDPVLALRTE
ncbi:MAG: ABC transporter permease, partial [Lachnospiraceae bacterium]|nr:ABC transporter permease [Lachnospiraceae bacterium]